MGKRFQVKRVTVKPGAALSLQKHHHRAEHWVIVSGTAEVTRNEEVFPLAEIESTLLPLGAVHNLRNPGKVPLELIEVLSGSYLGEDNTVWLEDVYGRAWVHATQLHGDHARIHGNQQMYPGYAIPALPHFGTNPREDMILLVIWNREVTFGIRRI